MAESPILVRREMHRREYLHDVIRELVTQGDTIDREMKNPSLVHLDARVYLR